MKLSGFAQQTSASINLAAGQNETQTLSLGLASEAYRWVVSMLYIGITVLPIQKAHTAEWSNSIWYEDFH